MVNLPWVIGKWQNHKNLGKIKNKMSDLNNNEELEYRKKHNQHWPIGFPIKCSTGYPSDFPKKQKKIKNLRIF